MKLIIKNATDMAELVAILVNNNYLVQVEGREEDLSDYTSIVEYSVEVLNADK